MRIFVTVLCLFALIFQVKADERKKTYEKKISKCELEELTINNKHGKIEVVQHDQEALEVVAEMKVVAKTAAKADEALELIQVVETPIGNSLHLETQLGKEMNVPQFLTSYTISIQYKITIPKGVKLRLITSLGDVFLGDFEGEINADIQHGNFRAGILKGGEVNIKQYKGEFQVKEVADLNGEFKNCSLLIQDGDDICLTTSSCDGQLVSINKLNIRSSGGILKIGDVEEVMGSSSFTKYEIQDLAHLLDMDMKMGEMQIRNVQKPFSKIHLNTSFTKVGLTFPQGAGYQLDLKRNKALKLELPSDIVLNENAERNKLVSQTQVGDKQYTGQVKLELANGTLYIQ